jgi:aconitate hydratase
VLPFRSNIEKISEFVYWQVDDTYHERALESKKKDGHAIVAGHNYGQGSSREHAAIAPRYLGLRVVFAKSFARIHWQNLPNFGILPLEFEEESAFDVLDQGDVLFLPRLHESLRAPERRITACNETKDSEVTLAHRLSERQVGMVLKGGLIPVFKERLTQETGSH